MVNVFSNTNIKSLLVAKKNIYIANHPLILSRGSELVELRGLVEDVRTAFERGKDATIYIPKL